MPAVESDYVGDVWPEAQFGAEPVQYGSVTLTPTGTFEAERRAAQIRLGNVRRPWFEI